MDGRELPLALAEASAFWSAVAERSVDTAFESGFRAAPTGNRYPVYRESHAVRVPCPACRPKRRGAPLPAALQNRAGNRVCGRATPMKRRMPILVRMIRLLPAAATGKGNRSSGKRCSMGGQKLPQDLAEALAFWSAVAERSVDTAFESGFRATPTGNRYPVYRESHAVRVPCPACRPKRRGAPLPAALQNRSGNRVCGRATSMKRRMPFPVRMIRLLPPPVLLSCFPNSISLRSEALQKVFS